MNWAVAIQVAKFVIWLILNIRDLVLEAEMQDPVPNRGTEKKAAVIKAVKVAATVAGMTDAALKAVEPLVDEELENAVSTTINANRQ